MDWEKTQELESISLGQSFFLPDSININSTLGDEVSALSNKNKANEHLDSCPSKKEVKDKQKENQIEEKLLFNYYSQDSRVQLIGRKRIFNVVYPDIFSIFHKPQNNSNNIKQFIDKCFDNSTSPSKKGRRDDSDNIRKRIKAKFIKKLKKMIKNIMDLKPSEKFFFLPQEFIKNVSKQKNQKILDLTMKQIFEKYKSKIVNKNKDSKLFILNYIELKKQIYQNYNIDIFLNKQYYQIFDEYLGSLEFYEDISSLKTERKKDGTNSKDYIENYFYLAKNLNHFFYN